MVGYKGGARRVHGESDRFSSLQQGGNRSLLRMKFFNLLLCAGLSAASVTKRDADADADASLGHAAYATAPQCSLTPLKECHPRQVEKPRKVCQTVVDIHEDTVVHETCEEVSPPSAPRPLRLPPPPLLLLTRPRGLWRLDFLLLLTLMPELTMWPPPEPSSPKVAELLLEVLELLEALPNLQLLLALPLVLLVQLVLLEAPLVLLEDTERGTPRPTPAMAPLVLLEESLPTPAPRGVLIPPCAPPSP